MRTPSMLGLVIGLSLSARADAATLTLTTDKAFYLPGETVTITAVGNSGGATDFGLFGSLRFDPDALLSPTAITFTPTTGTAQSWIPGFRGCTGFPVGPGECWVINYIAFPDPLGMDPVEQTLAILTATAGLPGVYSVEWSDAFGNELYFFGLDEGPGAALTIFNTSFQVIPEPSTALLIGLGLIGLASRRRRAR